MNNDTFADHIKRLLNGDTVQFRPRGNSMKPLIESGHLCTVAPIADHVLAVGDIVLCKAGRRHYLHLVSAVGHRDFASSFQISNNLGRINGWIPREQIFGRLVQVDP